MDRDYGVQEIDLIDLLFYILRRWRTLLIGMVVMAVLFSTVMYVRHNAQHTEETKEEVEEVPEAAQFLVDAIEARETYVEESLLMKVNPYAENAVVLYYYVDTDYRINLSETIEENPAKDIVREYQDYLQSNDTRRQIAEALKLDINPYYIGELIKTNNETDNRFSVTVIGITEEQAEQMADQIETIFAERRTKIQDVLGTHELTLLNRNSVCVVNWDVYDAQKEVYDTIESLQTDLDALGVDLQQMEEERGTTQESRKVSFFRLKYIIVGGIGGIVIVGCVIAAMYVFSGKLHTADELNRMYQISMLGTIGGKDKTRNPIDRLLDRLSGKTLSNEEQMALTIETIKLVSRDLEQKAIYITGSQNWQETNKTIVQTLGDGLKNNGIEMIYGDNILADAKSLKNMSETGAVVLLEKIGTSKCKDIFKIQKKISLCDCELLGGIVIE